MNEKIQHIIQDIRSKKDALSSSLNQQTARTNELVNEVEQLKNELENKNLQIAQLTDDNIQLKSDTVELKLLLEQAKNQVVNNASTEKVSQEQVDELVREIEYCIGQLKNNA